MKWRSRKGKRPEDFEKRQQIIFAFWPHKTIEGYWVWFEPVVSLEFYGPFTGSWRRDKYSLIQDSTSENS